MSTEKMIHWWSLIYANIRSSNRNFHTLTFSSYIHQISYHLFRLICQITMEAHRQWRVFTKWSLAQLTIDSNFHRTIIFNNETHFWMNGYVNKRDWICDDTKSHENLEHPIPPEKLSLWYRFRSGGSIGIYFFENDFGQTITVNGKRFQTELYSVSHSSSYIEYSASAI